MCLNKKLIKDLRDNHIVSLHRSTMILQIWQYSTVAILEYFLSMGYQDQISQNTCFQWKGDRTEYSEKYFFTVDIYSE